MSACLCHCGPSVVYGCDVRVRGMRLGIHISATTKAYVLPRAYTGYESMCTPWTHASHTQNILQMKSGQGIPDSLLVLELDSVPFSQRVSRNPSPLSSASSLTTPKGSSRPRDLVRKVTPSPAERTPSQSPRGLSLFLSPASCLSPFHPITEAQEER